MLLSDASLAGRPHRTPRELARKLHGELDAVRLRGVASDCLHEAVLVMGPDLVAAVAADCLASEHVAADNPDVPLVPR